MAKYKRSVRGGRLVGATLYTRPEPKDSPRARAAKKRATTKARNALNLKQSRQKLEFLIAANFNEDDFHLVLDFDNEHLPKNRLGAVACFKKFVRKLRKYRRARGLDVKYIYAVEGKHGDKRLHIHVIINAEESNDIEIFRSLWAYGNQTHAERLGGRGEQDSSVIARYLTKEREDGKPVGAKSWVGSRNLRQPEVEHGFCADDETLIPPLNCYVLEVREETNEFGTFKYIKYLLPEQPTARSKRQKNRRKKKAKQPLSLDW